MKNDAKIQTFITQCWQQYMSAENGVVMKDNQKAELKCKELIDIQFSGTETSE